MGGDDDIDSFGNVIFIRSEDLQQEKFDDTVADSVFNWKSGEVIHIQTKTFVAVSENFPTKHSTVRTAIMHLTNSPSNHHLPVAVSDDETAGAPADEIEITPAMIEAGVEVACLFDDDEPEEWKVAAVFRAMEERRRSLSR